MDEEALAQFVINELREPPKLKVFCGGDFLKDLNKALKKLSNDIKQQQS